MHMLHYYYIKIMCYTSELLTTALFLRIVVQMCLENCLDHQSSLLNGQGTIITSCTPGFHPCNFPFLPPWGIISPLLLRGSPGINIHNSEKKHIFLSHILYFLIKLLVRISNSLHANRGKCFQLSRYYVGTGNRFPLTPGLL